MADEYGYGADTREALHAFVRRNLDMLRRARAAGIPIVLGSDAVMTMFGENSREQLPASESSFVFSGRQESSCGMPAGIGLKPIALTRTLSTPEPPG